MKVCGYVRFNLTNAEQRHTTLLTLVLSLSLFSHLSCADTPKEVISDETRQRISDVENYIRHEAFHGVSLLPSEARTAIGWVSGQWHPVSISNNESDESGAAPLVGSVDQETGGSAPVNLGSNFHHKGFLPTHDAMLMGMGIEQNAFENKLGFTLRPFYGQGWRSLQGYWGSEVAMNIAQRADGMPWGKISIAYTDGNETLTDHGRGIDLHGDVDLTNHFSFTSGVRQDDITGSSNYAMLRWKVSFGDNSR